MGFPAKISLSCIWVDIPVDWSELLYVCKPVVQMDGCLVGCRCMVTRLPNFLGWIDFLSYGALLACAWSSALNVSSEISPSSDA